ncbi:hypothetical protein D3C85_1080540 [compost metagenome]
MSVQRGLPNLRNQLHPFVGVVARHRVAQVAQGLFDQRDELRFARRAVTVAQHKISQRMFALPAQAFIGIVGHRMQVQMPHRAEARFGLADGTRQGGVIRLVIRLDAMPHFGQAQLAVIDRRGFVHAAPDQPFAQAGFLAGRQRMRPRLGQQFRVQVLQRAVRIDVHARKVRRNQGRTQRGRRRPQRVHVCVFALAQLRPRGDRPKILGIVLTAMRRITDQRQRRPLGFMHGNHVEIGKRHRQSA